MDRAEFEAVVDEVIAELPEWVVERIDNLDIAVVDQPTAEQIRRFGGLLGLYEGVSLADRGVNYFGAMPDRISIFHRAHLRLGLNDTQLRAQIRRTVLHEVAHHLGISDDRLHELGWG